MISRNTVRTTIIVDEIDFVNRTVHGIDNKGGKFQASWGLSGTSFQIPSQGDRWTICRHGYTWYLDTRYDSGDEASVKSNLNPGDVHLRTPGKLVIDSDVLTTGSGSIAATTRDTAVTSGASYTLSGIPVHEYTIQVYAGGVFLHPVIDWTLTSTHTISFTTPLGSNTKLTVYYQRQGAEYRESATVTCMADFSLSLDLPYKDISTEAAVSVISAIESR